MIATTHISIHELASDSRLHLAPFSHEELEQYVPFPEEYTRFNPVPPEGKPKTAEDIMATRAADEHDLAWGIYTERPSVQNFVGIVSLSEVNAGTAEQAEWSSSVQEIHTGLFSSKWHGKGIGTLAKLAVIAYALEHHDTHAIYAYTSEHNVGAHRSLKKVGFSHLHDSKYFDFKDEGTTQSWMLADPRAQEHLGDDQATLAEGWKRYQTAHETIRLKENL
jgi:RimJ/RimL family protein N-acetyltransferase